MSAPRNRAFNATAAAAGLLLTVALSFNEAGALTLDDLIKGNVEKSKTPPAPTQEIKNLTAEQSSSRAVMVMQELKSLDKHFMQTIVNPPPGYKVAKDKQVQHAIDKMIALLNRGMDPNYKDPKDGTSLFAMIIWAASNAQRPDFVETAIKNGAKAKQEWLIGMRLPETENVSLLNIYEKPNANPETAPPEAMNGPPPPSVPDALRRKTKMAPMDQALRALLAQQTSTVAYLEAATEIVRILHKAGARASDAVTFASDPDFGDKYENFAGSLMGLKIMVDKGLVEKKVLEDLLSGPEEGRKEFAEAALTEDLLKKYGAPVLDYRDARPGHPEPYKAEEGDTLRKIATRFVHAMDMDNEDEALKKLAKENHMDLSAKDAADKPLEKGKTLFIPVPPEHQIGQITILKNGGGATPGAFALIGATSRLQEKMGATDLPDATTTIRAINQIPERAPDPFVFPGTPLSYPLKDKKGFDVTVVEPLDILRGIAATLTQIADFHDKPGAHKQGTKDIESLMREIARMSGLDYEALKTGDAVIAPGQAIWVNYFNDSITNLKTLPPATKKDGKEVSLIIIEGERDKPDEANYHGKMTMRAAAGTAFSLNPGAGLSNIFRNNEGLLSIGEYFSKTPNIKVNDFAMNAASQSLRLLLGRPDVIFSHSMALSAPQKIFDAFRDSQDDDSIAYAGNRFLIERMMGEYRSPMMSAAGNFRWSSPQVGGFSPEGPYIQDHATMHTPYAVNIGAASISERPGSLGEIVIEDYSSYAGDICAVIPEFQGERESGTSFSTPVFAGIQKEAMERYGESLTAGEIITAAMMVARRNVLDLDYTGGRFEWPKEKPENDISLNGLIALRLLPVPAWFDVNGGGLPHHIRCGAGVLDADGVMKLDLTLKEMKEIKEKNMNGAGAEFEKILSAGAPETRTVRDEKDGKEKKEYVYKISAPENLTLSRLTFFVPQAVRMHSDITVITPAGFKKILPRSHVGGIVSMNAFAIEDVRKGDVFEIYAEQPLGKTAGMILRGWENGGKPDGNVIQIMRDRLRMEGILPAPLTFLVGGKVVESKAKEVELRKLNDLPNVQPLGKNPNETDESGRNSSGPAGSAPSP